MVHDLFLYNVKDHQKEASEKQTEHAIILANQVKSDRKVTELYTFLSLNADTANTGSIKETSPEAARAAETFAQFHSRSRQIRRNAEVMMNNST